MPQPFYIQDLTLGQKFTSESYTITAEDIKTFATQFDPQPFHMDEEAARQTFFHGLAASGWHTAAISMRLMVQSVPIAGGLIGAGIESLKWTSPVRPGDVLYVESEVLSLRSSLSKPEQGLVRIRHTTFNQHSLPVQQMIATIVVPKREP